MRGRKVTSCRSSLGRPTHRRHASQRGGQGGGIYVAISGGVWVAAGASGSNFANGHGTVTIGCSVQRLLSLRAPSTCPCTAHTCPSEKRTQSSGSLSVSHGVDPCGSARGTLQLTQPSWYDDSSASALASASASASAVEKRSVPNARAKHPSSTGQPNATTNAAVASGQASKVTNRMRISDFAFFTDRPSLVNSSAGACLGPHARQASQRIHERCALIWAGQNARPRVASGMTKRLRGTQRSAMTLKRAHIAGSQFLRHFSIALSSNGPHLSPADQRSRRERRRT